MVFIKKARPALKRLKQDESGMAAISWALSLTVIIGAMGAAVDFSILSHAYSRSQAIADTTALAAAVYVRDFEQIPDDREKGLVGEYTAHELGYDYRDWVVDGAEGVSINVSYDDVKREATATVLGYTQPTIMQILGFGELEFGAKSVVKYEEKDVQDPVSVVMVMDNSGSMAWDDTPVTSNNGSRPNPHQSRIAGLETAAINFMDKLYDVVGEQDAEGPDDAVLRTGLLAFATNTTITRDMDWGVLSEGEITAMGASGWTNSAPPLKTAKEWLTLPHNEDKAHKDENGRAPGKYVVLMTDGKNTVGEEEWVAREGTENWRRWVTDRESSDGLSDVETNVVEITPEDCRIELENRWDYLCNFSDANGNNWQRTIDTYSYDRRPQSGSYDYWTGPRNNRTNVRVIYNCASQQTTPLEKEVCTPAEFETRYSGYEYFEGQEPYDNDSAWEEGEFDIESNILTREECDALHAADVNVFTIAFALEPGTYYRNNYYTTQITPEDSNKARAILQYCASAPQNFITADNAEALNDTFTRIGDTILKEIIRISS